MHSLLLGASPLAGFDMGKEFTSGMLRVISAGASDDLELTHARMWAFAPFRAASRMPEVRKWIDDMMLREYDWAHGRPASPRARRLDPPPAARLREIRAPTLVVVGDSDMTALVKEAEFVHNSIPQSSITRIRNAGHFPNIERPREFDRIALAWLKRVAALRPSSK